MRLSLRMSVLFDIYSWNNAWGYHYDGSLILGDGDVRRYRMTKEDGFDPSLTLKRSRSVHVRTLTTQMLSKLHTLFDPILETCQHTEQNGFDMPHISYKGYHASNVRIELYQGGGETCVYDSKEDQAKAQRLKKLLDLCIAEENECVYCHKKGANEFDDESDQMFCDETCRHQYIPVTDVLAEKDIPVMMMRPENGRRKTIKHDDDDDDYK